MIQEGLEIIQFIISFIYVCSNCDTNLNLFVPYELSMKAPIIQTLTFLSQLEKLATQGRG